MGDAVLQPAQPSVAAGARRVAVAGDPDAELWIMRTGKKIATHRHLAQFTGIHAVDELNDITETALRSLQEKTSAVQDFAGLMTEYGVRMQKLGLLSPETSSLLEKVKSIKGVLGAKGCGALGADAVALCVHKEYTEHAYNELKSLHLEVFRLRLGNLDALAS